MRLKRNQYYQPNRGGGALKALAVVIILGGVSLCLAFVWQNAQQGLLLQEPASPESTNTSDTSPSSAAPEGDASAVSAPVIPQEAASGTESASSASSESIEEPDAEEAVPVAELSDVSGAVPKSPSVDNSYFADAIFFGDSLSTGIPLYQVAGNPDTVAFTGINPESINTSEVIATPDGKKTILEAAKQYGDKKRVYIMLGANGLWMDEKSFIAGYQTFLTSVKEQYPDAVVYLQSILPVTEHAKDTYDMADNDVIRSFNAQIYKLAGSNGVHYVNVAQALMDENGALPDEASPTDGMHLTPEYYTKWFEYLKTHTVEEK